MIMVTFTSMCYKQINNNFTRDYYNNTTKKLFLTTTYYYYLHLHKIVKKN